MKKNFNIKIDTSVIYNPIYLNTEKLNINNYNNSQESFNVVTVGRLIPVKNQSHLIKSISHLPDNVTLDIYGEGKLESKLQHHFPRS